jgi:hypothetical protein
MAVVQTLGAPARRNCGSLLAARQQGGDRPPHGSPIPQTCEFCSAIKTVAPMPLGANVGLDHRPNANLIKTQSPI